MYSNMIATFTEMAARRSSVASLLLWLAVLGQGRESSEEITLCIQNTSDIQLWRSLHCRSDRSMHTAVVRSMDPTIGPTETAVTLIIMHCKLTERFGSEDCFAAHKLLIQSFVL